MWACGPTLKNLLFIGGIPFSEGQKSRCRIRAASDCRQVWPKSSRLADPTTLAHYLDLLEGAGMACGLPKYMGQVVRQRASSPKLQVYNNALLGCHWLAQGLGLAQAQARPEVWGRLVESAVGADLLARQLKHSIGQPQVFYWNKGQKEVDYILNAGGELWALEVKSGKAPGKLPGLEAFCKLYPEARPMIVGSGGMDLETWLMR